MRAVRVAPGATLIDAAVQAGVWIDTPCGGDGECGKCVVRVTGGLADPTGVEKEHLTEEGLRRGARLACQASVAGDCTVETPGTAELIPAKTGLSGAVPLAVQLPTFKAGRGPALGGAIDIGTTTLCASCIDLRTGERLGIASSENPQTRFGADVMTRIERCRRDPDAAGVMHENVTSELNGLLSGIAAGAGRSPGELVRLVLVGNTTMIHLALGEDPSPLGSYPFEPVVRGPVEVEPSGIGLDAAPGAMALVPPLMSGFLGADILAVMLATETGCSPGARLVIDLGTNGEIALGSSERILACSTAAGPAFEGMEISSGMRAVPGAIESFSRDGHLAPKALGGGKPLGICGSGLLDAAAALLETGLLRPNGRLVPPDEAEAIIPGRVRDDGNMREFLLAAGTQLYLTQQDVRQFQLAKGAVSSGIQVLASMLGTDYAGVEIVNLAGVFGSFVKPASAVAVGLLPAGLEGRIEFAGNAALLGAEMMLVSEKQWDRALRLAARSEPVELSGDPLFEKLFIENLSFRSLKHSQTSHPTSFR